MTVRGLSAAGSSSASGAFVNRKYDQYIAAPSIAKIPNGNRTLTALCVPMHPPGWPAQPTGSP
eukprot:CAMPEP_0184298896 /NCGR_PEP_ID=MMETSP1049-20130417/9612_1 /TAXON_ID=77928 /ORGANISM="Proteomonas sulcata, Strain CCMP704" /LENGTH=62 /DNA_ID=CAMNT_0026609165 /DNA_START=256 /DNA_END=444 /DNA_ORIENTATION=-